MNVTCRDFNAFVKAMVALILLATQRIAILDALFPGDLTMPGMLRMKVFFAERPHARIVRLDVTRADAYPGVVAVFTTKDVPVNEYGLQKNDQPVLCGLAPLPPFDFAKDRAGEGRGVRADIVRFVGDQIALVAAKTEDAAASARDLIEIEFEDLLVVADPITAMRPESPLIHPERGDSNVCVHYKIRKGAIVAGLAQADVVVESQYHLPFQEHTYLQPEAGLAYIDEEGCVMVQRGGQWPHADRAQIAHALGLPEEQILLPWHCTVWWMAWLWRLVLAFRADWDWRRLLPSSSTRSRRGFQ